MKYLKKTVSFAIALIALNSSLWCMEENTTIETGKNSNSSSYLDNMLLFMKCAERCKNICGVDLIPDVKRYINNVFSSLVIRDAFHCNFELSGIVDTPCYRSILLPSPDGKTILTLSSKEGSRVCLWNVKMEESIYLELKHFDINTDDINSVAFSPKGKTILIGSDDGTADLWDIKTGNLLRKFKHSNRTNSVAFSPKGKTILIGSDGGTAYLWDIKTGNLLRKFKHSHDTNSVAFSPDGKTILIGSDDGRVYLWSIETGNSLGNFVPYYGNTNSVAFSPNGKTILVGSKRPDGASLLDAETGTTLATLNHFSHLLPGVTIPTMSTRENKLFELFPSIAFSPDGRIVLTLSQNRKTICLWSVQTGKLLRELKAGNGGICSAAFSPDGKTIFATSRGSKLYSWSLSCEILKEVNFLQLGLIDKASQEKNAGKPLTILEGSPEYEVFMTMSDKVKEYLKLSYSVTAPKSSLI